MNSSAGRMADIGARVAIMLDNLSLGKTSDVEAINQATLDMPDENMQTINGTETPDELRRLRDSWLAVSRKFSSQADGPFSVNRMA